MDKNLTVDIDVIEYMLESVNEKDWNNRCDVVKSTNNGYPDFWYKSIVLGGIMAYAQANW